MPISAFIDGFAASPSDPGYATQRILDGELRNCHDLRNTAATNALLYPGFFAATDGERQSWLEPALRRAEWNVGRDPWFGYIAGLINLLLPTPPYGPPLSDEALLTLARLGPRLQRNGGKGECHHLSANLAAALRSRKEPLPSETRTALAHFVRHLINVHCHGPATFDIAWYLWRTGEAVDPCFSEIIRRETGDNNWSRFWDQRGCKPEKISGALKAIGPDIFAARWNDWMNRTAQQQPALMSAAGREVLLHLLHGCRLNQELPVDEGLCTLCGLRWAGEGNQILTKEWIGELLLTLATRPRDRMFACVERLVHNPDTNRFLEVQSTYQQLLAGMAENAVPRTAEVGVDGFALRSDPELFEQQCKLDRHLQYSIPQPSDFAVPQSAWNTTGLGTQLTTREALSDVPAFLRAITIRRRWLASRRPASPATGMFLMGGSPLDEGTRILLWGNALGELARQLLTSSPKLAESDLLLLLRGETESPSAAAGALFPLVQAHVDQHGYSAPLVESIRAWHGATHGSISAMDLRHRIGWLLWFEDVTPIRMQECWSNHVRAGLRGKSAAVRSAWRDLLENVSFGTGEKPPKKWLKPAAKALKAVGPVEFRNAVRTWFAPFHAPEPLRLTVVGRDILRNLLFYALLAEDPAVDEAISWFAAAQWKTKKDQTCVTVVLPAFAHVLIERSPDLAYQTFSRHKLPLAGKTLRIVQDLSDRLGHATPATAPVTTRPTPDPLAAMRKAMTAMLTGTAARLEGDELIVTGTRDSYTVRLSDGSMKRRSDGRPVHISFDTQDPVIARFRGIMDAMDLHDPFQPNYLRLKMCAELLANDEANQDLISVED